MEIIVVLLDAGEIFTWSNASLCYVCSNNMIFIMAAGTTPYNCPYYFFYEKINIITVKG